jgi:hypothetical protein
MNFKEWFGVFSVAISLASGLIYCLSILRRKTRPHILTWAVWMIVNAVVYCAQVVKHSGAGAWVTGLAVVQCLIVLLLAFSYGDKKIQRSDWVAFTLALLALPLWWVTDNPLIAVVLVTAADGFGFYPTFRKSYLRPYEETSVMYLLDMLKFAPALLAMSEYSLTAVLYPAFVLLSNGSFVAMLFTRRLKVKHA